MIAAPGRPGVVAGWKISSCWPSVRTSPLNVPNQRNPSGVCTMSVAEFSGSPSSVSHLETRNSSRNDAARECQLIPNTPATTSKARPA